jgi:restriction endonuclease S subunit
VNAIPFAPSAMGDLTISMNRGLSSSYLKDDGIPVLLIKAKDIADDGFVTVESVDHEWVKSPRDIDKARVRKGDVLITLKGNFRAAVVTEDFDNLVISANLIALRLNHRILPEVLVFYLNSSEGQQELQKRAGGSGVQSLNQNFLMEVPIPVIPMVLQEKLSAYLKGVQIYLHNLDRERTMIITLSKIVGSEMMRGSHDKSNLSTA